MILRGHLKLIGQRQTDNSMAKKKHKRDKNQNALHRKRKYGQQNPIEI